jgi:hypothetical protein
MASLEHECDLRAAPINVRSWESNGLNADVAFGPFLANFAVMPHNVTFLLPRCGRVRSSDRGEPMRRREFISLLSAAAAWPLAARAQQTPARPLIGMLVPLSVAAATGNIAAFRSALRDVGYVEGRNATLELRYGDGSLERLGPTCCL